MILKCNTINFGKYIDNLNEQIDKNEKKKQINLLNEYINDNSNKIFYDLFIMRMTSHNFYSFQIYDKYGNDITFNIILEDKQKKILFFHKINNILVIFGKLEDEKIKIHKIIYDIPIKKYRNYNITCHKCGNVIITKRKIIYCKKCIMEKRKEINNEWNCLKDIKKMSFQELRNIWIEIESKYLRGVK